MNNERKPYAQHAKRRPVRLGPGDIVAAGIIGLLLALATTVTTAGVGGLW